MTIKNIFIRYWFGIIIGLILVFLVIVILFSPNILIGRIESISTILGWSLLFVKYLYEKWEGFYIRTNKTVLWILNKEIQWDFNIELSAENQNFISDKLWKIIKEYENTAVRWHGDDRKLIVNMKGYTIRIFNANYYDGDDISESISIQVSNLKLPYRIFKDTIECKIIPLLALLNDNIDSINEKYVIKIMFGSSNPFFGYFIRKLELPKVVSFSCDFIEDSIGNQEQVVTVRKDRIDIVTDNLNAARNLSLKYTAFELN